MEIINQLLGSISKPIQKTLLVLILFNSLMPDADSVTVNFNLNSDISNKCNSGKH